MNPFITDEIHKFLNSISDDEKKKNKKLKNQISFLKKYLGIWRSGNSQNEIQNKTPYSFYIKNKGAI